MTRRMVAAVANPHTDVLGTAPAGWSGGRGTRPEQRVRRRGVFAACAEHDVAVEINSRPERRDPPTRLLALAVEAGCLFSSTPTRTRRASSTGALRLRAGRGVRRPADRIVNTWPVEHLLAWTRTTLTGRSERQSGTSRRGRPPRGRSVTSASTRTGAASPRGAPPGGPRNSVGQDQHGLDERDVPADAQPGTGPERHVLASWRPPS